MRNWICKNLSVGMLFNFLNGGFQSSLMGRSSLGYGDYPSNELLGSSLRDAAWKQLI